MNKELTTIQMLIEEIKSMKSVVATEGRRYVFQQVLDWLDVGLSIEQEQIEKAFSEGHQEAVRGECGQGSKYKDAIGVDYYQSKYGGGDVDR